MTTTTTTTTMTRKTYALLVLGLLLVPLPGVLLASSRGQSGALPRDFITVEVEVYKNNELWLRDYADPVNAYWLESMIGSLFFPAIKYIYGYYSIDGHYLVNGLPMTTAETLTLGGVNATNITNYGWIMISPGTVLSLTTQSAIQSISSASMDNDSEYALKLLLAPYQITGWCSEGSSVQLPVINLDSNFSASYLSSYRFSLITEPLLVTSYAFPYGSVISTGGYASVVLPIGLLELWEAIYLSDSLLAIRSTSSGTFTTRVCFILHSIAVNVTRAFRGPIIALIGYSLASTSVNIAKIIDESLLYPSLGVIEGLPSITYTGGLGFPGIGVTVTQGEGVAQEGPRIVNESLPKAIEFSGIEWKPYLPQIRDNRLVYIYDTSGIIFSNFIKKYYPIIAEESSTTNYLTLPYSAIVLNTTSLSISYDDIHHEYLIEIEASGQLPETYPEYNVFALELLSPYLIVGSSLMINGNLPRLFPIAPTNVPPVAIDFPNKYLVLYPGDKVKVVYRIKIRQDWPWTRNFYSYLIDYGIGVKWYYVVHNESLPTILQFVDKDGIYHSSLFNFDTQEIPIPIPMIELSSEPITPQTLDVYTAYKLPNSIGSFEAQAATLVLYKDSDLIRIATTLGFEVSNITKATSLARSIGIYIAPYKDTSFLLAAIPIQNIKLVSESSRTIRSNQYLYAMTIWLGVDLRGGS